MLTDKIWANSGDSHAMEPDDLWERELPPSLAERGPCVSRDERMETVHVDDQVAFRTLASFADAGSSAPGARDPKLRLADLDEEGVWGQLMFPSRGLWVTLATDPVLYEACARVYNDWMLSDMMSVSPRLVGVAMLSSLSTDDAVAELQRVVSLGYQAVMVPCTAPEGRGYNDEVWDPLWAAAEEAGVVVAFHVGTGASPKAIKGPGAVVSNYVETFVPGRARGVPPRGVGCARAAPRLARAHRRGRCIVGAGTGRPHGRGMAPARAVREAEAHQAAQRDDLRTGLRVLPARSQRSTGVRGDGISERHVG